MLPKRIAPTLKIRKIDEKYAMAIAKMNIAHELTHALQDQYINFAKKFSKIAGREGLDAFHATIEGHAVFVQKKVGKQLKIDSSIIDLHPLVNSSEVIFKDPKLREMHASALFDMKRIYSGGEKFLEYHYSRSGNELVWKILANPPVSTSMISYPDTYSYAASYDDIDYKSILENLYDFQKLDDLLKGFEFTYTNFSLTKLDLSSMNRRLDLADKELIISKVVHFQTFQVKCQNTPFAYIDLVVLEDKQYVPKFISLREKTLKASYFHKPAKNVKVESSFTKSADISRKISADVSFSENSTTKRTFSFFGKDNLIVECYDDMYNLGDQELVDIANKIFVRYQDAKNRKCTPKKI